MQNNTLRLYQKGMEKAMIDFENRELGGGSYPEPPDTPETERPVCDECGEEENVKEVSGIALCRACREEFYLQAYQDKMWEFINREPIDRYNFSVNFWFSQLPKNDQAVIAMEALKREFSFPLSYNEAQLQALVSSYAREYKSEFADYLDKTEAREVVS